MSIAKNQNIIELYLSLLSILKSVPEEKSVSITSLLNSLYPDFAWKNGCYFFSERDWSHIDILTLALDFPQIASKHGFYLDSSKYNGGVYGTPENLSFFVRRKPISRKILFQLKEYPAEITPETLETKQVKVYYDGAVKYETTEKTYMIDKDNTLKKAFGGTYLVNKKIVEKIQGVYKNYKTALNSLSHRLDNGSCDGMFQEFKFGIKKIRCLNIAEHSEEEKMVLHIFSDIKSEIDSLTPKEEWSIPWGDFQFLQ